jgi:hypothetical protein
MKSKKFSEKKAIKILAVFETLYSIQSVIDYAAILKLKYYNCYQCEASQPMLKTESGKTCCVCGSVKRNKLTKF